MDPWTTYTARLDSGGDESHTTSLDHNRSAIQRRIKANLSYKQAFIGDKEIYLAVTDSDELNTKNVYSMPGEDLPHGAVIRWADSMWLITERDAHRELYTKGVMKQCNYILKWINTDGDVVSRWCIVEDGTKYLIGEKSEDMMSVGDARIAVTIGKDPETSQLNRGRRFLIDDLDSNDVLAYQITKPNKLYNIYNGAGVFRFILSEVNATDDDNKELRIADYYNWKPRIERPVPDIKTDDPLEKITVGAKDLVDNRYDDLDEKKVWL